MSRSSYNTSTVEDRDYESRRDRERERARAADRYDGDESRHHGKWTASSETTDLEGGSAPRRTNSRRADRDDRDDRDYDRDYRSRGSSSQYGDRYDNYGPQSGYVPPPPPMPPADFYEPHGTYRQSHPYAGHQGYGSSRGYDQGYDQGFGGYGSHPFGGWYHPSQHYGGYGMMHERSLYDHPAYGYDQGFGGYGQHNSAYELSHPSQFRGMHPIQMAFLEQQRRGFGNGLHHQRTRGLGGMGMGGMGGYGGHSGYAHHELIALGFHGPRPSCDIYELGNDYIIEVDLPGHSRDHVDIKLSGNELFVISKPPKRDFSWHINERALGKHNVERKFYLPADVNTSAIAPVLANGVLRLVLPRNGSTFQAPRTATTATTVDTTTTTTTTSQAVNV